jgi:hypothetical protein
VWVPLVALAHSSVIAGYLISRMIFGEFFKGAIEINLEAQFRRWKNPRTRLNGVVDAGPR